MAELETDQREGVPAPWHQVLDRASAFANAFGPGTGQSALFAMALAKKAVSAAERADPFNGMGARRIDRTVEAAALLLAALLCMDKDGSDKR